MNNRNPDYPVQFNLHIRKIFQFHGQEHLRRNPDYGNSQFLEINQYCKNLSILDVWRGPGYASGVRTRKQRVSGEECVKWEKQLFADVSHNRRS